MAQNRQHNFDYFTYDSYEIPKCVGDLYRPQDTARDFNYLKDRAGQALVDIHQKVPVLIEGGAVTQGTGSSLNIAAGVGYVKFQVKCPGDFDAQDPPVTVNRDIIIRLVWTAQTDYAVTDPGGSTHYLVLKYKLDDKLDRERYYTQDTSLSTTYFYEQEDSFEIAIETTAPEFWVDPDYKLCLASFTGTSGSYTITSYTAHRSIIFIDSATPELQIVGDVDITGDTVITGDLTVDGTLAFLDVDNLQIKDKKIEINKGGTTAGTIDAGLSILGDSDTEVGYYKVDTSDNSLLTLKAPTGNILTINTPVNSTIDISNDFTIDSSGSGFFVNGVSLATGLPVYKEIEIPIGDWDMVSTGQLIVSIGLDDSFLYKIKIIEVLVREDSNGAVYPLDHPDNSTFVPGGRFRLIKGGINPINIVMNRQLGGFFDQVAFDDTSYNRGWIYVKYYI